MKNLIFILFIGLAFDSFSQQKIEQIGKCVVIKKYPKTDPALSFEVIVPKGDTIESVYPTDSVYFHCSVGDTVQVYSDPNKWFAYRFISK